MEKVEIKTRQIEDRTHHFYCDDCNAYIGSSHEYDDGWYQPMNELELCFHGPRGSLEFCKCLCDDCWGKHLSKIYKALEDVGFKPDRYDDEDDD